MDQSLLKNENCLSHFTKCECGSGMLEIERYYYDGNDQGFYFTMWECSRNKKYLSLRERIRWCCRILITGNLWTDNIIVSNKNAHKIAKFINKNLLTKNIK